MYKFLAKRIHDEFLTWEELREVKSEEFVKEVEQAYISLYGAIAIKE